MECYNHREDMIVSRWIILGYRAILLRNYYEEHLVISRRRRCCLLLCGN